MPDPRLALAVTSLTCLLFSCGFFEADTRSCRPSDPACRSTRSPVFADAGAHDARTSDGAPDDAGTTCDSDGGVCVPCPSTGDCDAGR